LPEAQRCPAAHVIPHPPQFFASLFGSMHWPLHDSEPVGQAHAPPAHTWPPPHVWPQEPQLAGSFNGSTQVPPQLTKAARHTHCRSMQRSVTAQALSHEPQ
jgi:hypothetical protein